MATQAEGDRVIHVSVENEDGVPVIGARIEILIDGVPYGDLTTSGESSIQIDNGLTVELRAFAAQFSTAALVGPHVTAQTLVIPTNLGIEVAAIPTARCPDGKAGQPCVDCTVRGHKIRICA